MFHRKRSSDSSNVRVSHRDRSQSSISNSPNSDGVPYRKHSSVKCIQSCASQREFTRFCCSVLQKTLVTEIHPLLRGEIGEKFTSSVQCYASVTENKQSAFPLRVTCVSHRTLVLSVSLNSLRASQRTFNSCIQS